MGAVPTFQTVAAQPAYQYDAHQEVQYAVAPTNADECMLLDDETLYEIYLRTLKLTTPIDGHKQLFVLMGSGVLLLRNPEQCRFVAETASYIIRKGSLDAGRFTLEGSRPRNVIYLHTNMKCLGSDGFEMIVN